MKRNIIILSVLAFLFSAALWYLVAEVLYKERISVQTKITQENIVSNIELTAPEIKAALSKPDDISLLYSIEKLSKIKSVQESFIIDTDLNILIHDNSEKWNKKYDQDFYRELVKIKEMAVRNIDQNTINYTNRTDTFINSVVTHHTISSDSGGSGGGFSSHSGSSGLHLLYARS